MPRLRSIAKNLLLLCIVTLLCAASLSAQTLARPGWVGSGITPQTWWRRAVFYQLDKTTQITKDEIASLEAFGVDALVLPVEGMALPPEAAPNNNATPQPLSVDDLFSECSRQHMRVLVTLDTATPNTTSDATLALAKSWLYRGAAGFVLLHLSATPSVAPASVPAPDPAAAPTRHHRSAPVHAIHLAQTTDPPIIAAITALLKKFPGDHILIADSTTPSPSITLHLATLSGNGAPGADISSHTLLSLSNGGVLTPIDAARLLLTPASALIDARAIPPASLLHVFPPLAPPPTEPETTAATPPPPPPSNVYGTFTPYVPKDTTAERAKEVAEKKAADEAAAIAAATFPIQSDYEPILQTEEGYIAYYHRLVQLHHTAEALIDGEVHPLDAPQPALAWAITRAGASPIVVVLNPSATAQSFDMTTALHGIVTPRLAFRTLSHTAASSGVVHPEHVTVGPNGVFAGELVPGYVYR